MSGSSNRPHGLWCVDAARPNMTGMNQELGTLQHSGKKYDKRGGKRGGATWNRIANGDHRYNSRGRASTVAAYHATLLDNRRKHQPAPARSRPRRSYDARGENAPTAGEVAPIPG